MRRLNHTRRGAVLGVVVLLFFSKSLLLTQILKRTLQKIPGVVANFGHAELAIFPGSLSFYNTTIETIEPPRAKLFDLEKMTVSWRWRDVLTGRLAASLSGHGGTFVLARLPPSPKQKKPSPHLSPKLPEAETILARWPDIRRRMVFFQIDALALEDLSLRYLDLAVTPALDLPIADIRLTGERLTNRPTGTQERPGHLHIEGKMAEGGNLLMEIHLALSHSVPDFRITLDADEIALRAFNPALSQYAGVLLDSGALGLSLEADARAGRFDGCVRPKLSRLRLQSATQGASKRSWAQKAAAKIADTAAHLLFAPDAPPRTAELKFSGTLPEGVTEEQGVLRLLAAALDAIKNEALTLKLAR